MFESFLILMNDPAVWLALATLIVMEVVLGIDNLLFISILTNKLPKHQRARARYVGITGALVMRLMLLGTIAFIVHLTEPVLHIGEHSFSWRDLILIAGGLFLVWKATKEIHHNVDPDPKQTAKLGTGTFTAVIGQIMLLDLVFSTDSILTAVGMTDHLSIMVIAVLVAVTVMLFAAGPLANFIHKNPTVVMLALGFLLLIGTTLIAEGFGAHIEKGYIYTAMAFAGLIEGLNIVSRKKKSRR